MGRQAATETTQRVLELTRKAAEAYDRPDLARRAAKASARLSGPAVRVLVVGEFKQGKSTLINALLNVQVCPTSDDIATVVPTMLRHGDEAEAHAVMDALPDTDDGTDTDADPDDDAPPPEPRREPVDLNRIADLVSESGSAEGQQGVRMLEVRVPRRMLESGLALIDTPGVGGLNSVHGVATEAAMGMADLVLFVTDASQEMTQAELDFMRRAHDRCPNMICVLTKIDIYPRWRKIRDLNIGHLKRADVDVEIVPVSSVLRQMAQDEGSKDLNEESGFPALVDLLNGDATAEAASEVVRQVLDEANFCLDQYQQTFEAEKQVLTDPDTAAQVMADLEGARDRATALRSRSARWQQTLNDGSQDLSGDADHDLRARLRQVVAEAEEAVENEDPAKIWEEFSPWLEQRVALEVNANGDMIRHKADELALKVADHFAIEEAGIGHGVQLPDVRRDRVGFETSIDLEIPGMGGNALTAARGAYGGVLMFGMVGQLAGLALLNPLTLVVGIGLGRKALREEKKRGLTSRQHQAKAAVRKHVDTVTFAVTKDTRDLVKRIQRELRDEFTSRAEQLQTSTKEALGSAEKAAKEEMSTRSGRLKDVDAELTRIGKVRALADKATTQLTSGD